MSNPNIEGFLDLSRRNSRRSFLLMTASFLPLVFSPPVQAIAQQEDPIVIGGSNSNNFDLALGSNQSRISLSDKMGPKIFGRQVLFQPEKPQEHQSTSSWSYQIVGVPYPEIAGDFVIIADLEVNKPPMTRIAGLVVENAEPYNPGDNYRQIVTGVSPNGQLSASFAESGRNRLIPFSDQFPLQSTQGDVFKFTTGIWIPAQGNNFRLILPDNKINPLDIDGSNFFPVDNKRFRVGISASGENRTILNRLAIFTEESTEVKS